VVPVNCTSCPIPPWLLAFAWFTFPLFLDIFIFIFIFIVIVIVIVVSIITSGRRRRLVADKVVGGL
jgi:hypothetical protein